MSSAMERDVSKMNRKILSISSMIMAGTRENFYDQLKKYLK